ncbi:MAG: hypothetical protein O7D33_07620 [Chloroflexi bacterium]|nr:hypothetical protein [Chloroflexota bacterium]
MRGAILILAHPPPQRRSPLRRKRVSTWPRLSARMDPEALRLAGERARAARKTVGRWWEEAIQEKIEREGKHDG